MYRVYLLVLLLSSGCAHWKLCFGSADGPPSDVCFVKEGGRIKLKGLELRPQR